MAEVVGAFSEVQTVHLANVSRHLLREWDRRGLLKPSYGVEDPHVPFGRVYSFRDVVSARVLGQLVKFRVSYKHLVEVHRELSAKSDAPWASTVLYVCGREVVVSEPGSRRRHKLLTGQQVFDIPLKVAITGVRAEIAKMNERTDDKRGKVEREKFVAQGQYVVKGTRVPVTLIASFARAGYTTAQILREYPGLVAEDVDAALRFEGIVAA